MNQLAIKLRTLESWVTNKPFVKMVCPQKYCVTLYFCKNVTCLNVGLLTIGEVFFVSPVTFGSDGYDKISATCPDISLRKPSHYFNYFT
jgi:hypothetical protein